MDLLNDAITVGIIGFLVLWFISKFRRETIKETMAWLKDLIMGEEDEQS